jgi:tRNA (guanine-N7-)-methyltransferase
MGQKPHGPLRSYGRIKARQLKSRQAALVQDRLPDLALPDPALGLIDPLALMPGASKIWLEIGFGGGEHMAAQALAHPDVLILGAEPFLNGAASALRHIDEQGLSNIRLLQGDARDLMAALPDGCLDRVFILFPDPWPKARHHKRRLVQAPVIQDLARLLRPGGKLRFATDWADYADWTLQRINRSPDFSWTAERAQDWSAPPADHFTTRYEEKKLGDCAPVFLDFVRV